MTKDGKIKVYVGCAILGLGDSERKVFLKKVVLLKDLIRAQGFEVMEFIGRMDAPSREVYQNDIVECVGTCDGMLAICDHPSTGMGYELATVIEKRGLPVLAVARTGSVVSKVILGISKPNFRFERYNDLLKDVPILLESHLKNTLG